MLTSKAKAIIIPTATSVTNPQYFSVSSEAKNSTAVKLSTANSSSVALHQSILNGRVKQVKYLLKLGSKVDIKDIYGRTCLMLACLSDQEEYGFKIAKLLLHYGADPNIQDYLGRSAVCIACSQKREMLVDLFVNKHATIIDFRQKDNDGNILLNHAAMYGTPKMCKSIIEKMNNLYISVDQRNNTGYTALLLAVKNKRWANAYVLLTDGQASAFLKDNEYFLNAVEWILVTSQSNNELQNAITHLPIQPTTSSSMKFISTKNTSQEFQLHKSHTMLSINSQASTYYKQPVNYKTWYGIPNPYYDFDDPLAMKCEHQPYKNFAVDHQKSAFTPAIFTPREAPRLSTRMQQQQQRQQQLSIFVQDSLQSFTNDEETENELLFRLMDKLQEKMRSTTNSTLSSTVNSAQPLATLQATQIQRRLQNEPPSQNSLTVERNPIFLTSVQSIPSSAQSKPQSKSRDKRLIQQFLLKQQEGIFFPDVRATSNLLNIQSRSQSNIKDELHNIFQYYTDANNILTSTSQNQHHQHANTASSFSNHNNQTTNRNSKLENHAGPNINSSLANKRPNKSIIQQQQQQQKNQNNKEVTFNLKN